MATRSRITTRCWSGKRRWRGVVWVRATCLTNLHGVDSTCTWAQATGVWIDAINAANLGGHNDWRVPNVKELQSLVDYGVTYPGPTIDTTCSRRYRCGPLLVVYDRRRQPDSAWPVNFSNGFVTVAAALRPTRSASAPCEVAGDRSFDLLSHLISLCLVIPRCAMMLITGGLGGGNPPAVL